MNIRHAFKMWNKPFPVSSTGPIDQNIPGTQENNHQEISSTDPISKMRQLAPGTPLDVPAGLAPQQSNVAPEAMRPRALMEAPELQVFFSDIHFGLGRHNGAQYKTQDALELGRQTLIYKFQNTLELLMAQRQAKVDALRNMTLQTQGLCGTITGQLNLACERLERDIATLGAQYELAAAGKGWVLKALNEYQIGFGKGLRDAVDMELLG